MKNMRETVGPFKKFEIFHRESGVGIYGPDQNVFYYPNTAIVNVST